MGHPRGLGQPVQGPTAAAALLTGATVAAGCRRRCSLRSHGEGAQPPAAAALSLGTRRRLHCRPRCPLLPSGRCRCGGAPSARPSSRASAALTGVAGASRPSAPRARRPGCGCRDREVSSPSAPASSAPGGRRGRRSMSSCLRAARRWLRGRPARSGGRRAWAA